MSITILCAACVYLGWQLRAIYAWFVIKAYERREREEEHKRFRNRYSTYRFWISERSVMK